MYNKVFIDREYINLEMSHPYKSSGARKMSGNGVLFVAGRDGEEGLCGAVSPPHPHPNRHLSFLPKVKLRQSEIFGCKQ